jgi:hypothetical protein
MNCYVKFKFTAGSVAGKFMSLKITAYAQVLFNGLAQDTFEIESSVNFPANIQFYLSGKNLNDVVVKDNVVVENKFVQLQSVTLDRIEIESWKIPTDLLCFDNRIEKFSNTFWDKNGYANLDINDSDPVCWLIDHYEILV